MPTFNAYDDGGVLLETFSASSDDGIFSFMTGGIFTIEALQPDENWGWDLANLTFALQVSQVPLPASLPLLLAGFGALGVMRKRRQS